MSSLLHTEQSHLPRGYSVRKVGQLSQFSGLQNPLTIEQYAPELFTVLAVSLLLFSKEFISLSVSLLKILRVFFDFFIKVIQYISSSVARSLCCVHSCYNNYQPHELESDLLPESLLLPQSQPIAPPIFSANREVESAGFLSFLFFFAATL